MLQNQSIVSNSPLDCGSLSEFVHAGPNRSCNLKLRPCKSAPCQKKRRFHCLKPWNCGHYIVMSQIGAGSGKIVCILYMMFVMGRNECMDMHKNWFPNAEGHCNSVPRHREYVCCVVVVLFTTFKPLRCGLLLPRPLYVMINYFWENSCIHNGWIEVLNITKIVDKPFLDAGTPIQCIYDNHVLTTWIYYVQNST